MSEFNCHVCGRNQYVYRYMIYSNGTKHYRQVCTHCGAKSLQSVSHAIAESCGYDIKEYTGKFHENWLKTQQGGLI